MYPPQAKAKKPVPGVGNPGAMTNGAELGAPAATEPQIATPPPMFNNANLGGGGNPQATTNAGAIGVPAAPVATTNSVRLGNPTDPAIPTAVAPSARPASDPFATIGGGVQLPTGEWVPKNHPLAGGAPATPGAPGAAAPGTAPPPTSMPMTAGDVTGTQAGSPQGPPTSIAQSFQQALIGRLNPGAATADDPAIRGSIQANKLAEQRGVDAQRNRLAEQAARDGTSGAGGTESMRRGLMADSAARQGQYAGDKVQHLSDQNNQSLLAALGMGGDFLQQNANRDQQGGQFNRTMDETRRTADQDAELRRLGISTQSRLGEGGLNNQLLGMLLNDRQFGRQLGQQNTQFGQSLDQSGILGMLGLL